MTAAEKRDALLADGARSETLTDRLLAQLLVDLSDVRNDLARREERRLKQVGAIPAGAPSGRASSNGSCANFPNYGKRKNEPVVGASMTDLDYYAAGCRRTLADSSKSRWHDKERALLGAIEAEIARQSGGSMAAPDSDGGLDDDIPF